MICPDFLWEWGRLLAIPVSTVGTWVALRNYNQNTRVNKSKFAMELVEAFISETDERKVWYQLNYNNWKWEIEGFRGSKGEMHLDALLYRISVAGQLLRNGLLTTTDFDSIYTIVRQVFVNEEFQKYLMFVKIDFLVEASIPDNPWPDAIFLYQKLLLKRGASAYEESERFKIFLKDMEKLKSGGAYLKEKKDLVGYDKEIPEWLQ